MFVDQIRIHAIAGSGGNGCSSFRREKFVPLGGPDGGDGGDGGSIILRADPQVDTLVNLYYEPIVRAKSGANGMGKQKYGRAAPDKIVPVPVGTLRGAGAQAAAPKTNASSTPREPETRADRRYFLLRESRTFRSTATRSSSSPSPASALPQARDASLCRPSLASTSP